MFLLLLFTIGVLVGRAQDSEFRAAREQMVHTQIQSRGINDQQVLDAMLSVERHKFVPAQYWDRAYDDHPLPIGMNQTISQPYIVAFMTEILTLRRQDKVLEIGTGSGYQAAILGEICDSVFTIEIQESLGIRANLVLAELGYGNVICKIGDGYLGWKEAAPFDAIIVTCSPTDIPKPLEEQLTEGGRMIIPVGTFGNQKLVLLRKENGKLVKKNVLNVMFVPMVDETGKKY